MATPTTGNLARLARLLESASPGTLPSCDDREVATVDLYWLPLGAGGRFVKLNGRVFEALSAWVQRRPRCDLYHSALEVQVAGERFVIEMAPVWNERSPHRGVVAEGSVGSPSAGRSRLFRYEVRRWRDGRIPDVDEAVQSPVRLSDDDAVARSVLDLVPRTPTLVWGRDELATGDMWNSNSLIAWLIARSGMDAEAIELPAGGRAPGWQAGLAVARRREDAGWSRTRGLPAGNARAEPRDTDSRRRGDHPAARARRRGRAAPHPRDARGQALVGSARRGVPLTDEPEATRLTIEVDGMIAGMIQYSEELEPKYRHAGIDLFLDPVLHGRGLGTEAVRRVVRRLVEDRGHHRITIDPAADNAAAIRAYEKAGFRAVVIMRRYERDVDGDGWHDGLLMELVA